MVRKATEGVSNESEDGSFASAVFQMIKTLLNYKVLWNYILGNFGLAHDLFIDTVSRRLSHHH